MLNLGWQDLIALSVVLAAAAYLARLAWRAVVGTRESTCGTGCARCSARTAGSSTVPEEVVAIGPIGQHGHV
jgi:hypothetical protein